MREGEDVCCGDGGGCVGVLAPGVKGRMEEFVAGVAAASMNHPVQRENAERYVRGLLGAGARKSLEPLVERLAGEADYQSLQQFLADSPWDPGSQSSTPPRSAPAPAGPRLKSRPACPHFSKPSSPSILAEPVGKNFQTNDATPPPGRALAGCAQQKPARTRAEPLVDNNPPPSGSMGAAISTVAQGPRLPLMPAADSGRLDSRPQPRRREATTSPRQPHEAT